MKIYEIKNLIDKYGGGKILIEILEEEQGNKIYKCPKCSGKGLLNVSYNAYPKGLPDSGWVDDIQYKDVCCELCNGEGYTEKKFKIKMIEDGYEEVSDIK